MSSRIDELSSLLIESGGALKGPLWQDLQGHLSSAEGLQEGTRVGQYRILREIGRGGMGVVYLAELADGNFSQQVALKVLRLGISSEEVILRFEQERRILASLHHPAITRLLDGGTTDDGRPFLVVEYVDGRPIDRYCDQHRLTIDQRLRFFTDLARAVQHAHRNLVVHRDLKPSNILITGNGQVQLLDFGIAKLLDSDAANAAPLSRIGEHPMTLEYASPEQIKGKPVTTASDVYQLGLLLYELLTGRKPYRLRGRSAGEAVRVICERLPLLPSIAVTRRGMEVQSAARRTRPEQLRTRLRGDLDNIVLMALHKNPERRYATAEELCHDIERHLACLPVAARKYNLRYRLRRFVQRFIVGIHASTMVIMLMGGLIGFYTMPLARERDRVQLEAEKESRSSASSRICLPFQFPTNRRGGARA